MAENYKDMTQEELRDLLAEKNGELFDLASEIDEETEFDILFFSAIGVSDGDFIKVQVLRLAMLLILLNYWIMLLISTMSLTPFKNVNYKNFLL